MKLKKTTLFVIILLVNAAFFALGMLVATWFYHQRDNDANSAVNNTTNESSNTVADKTLSEEELELFRIFYLPAFISASSENATINEAQGTMNGIIYHLGVKEINREEHENLQNTIEEGLMIYAKDDIETATSELLNEKAEKIITSSDMNLDLVNNIYTVGGNDASDPYVVTINDYEINDDGTIVFNVEYYESSDSEWFDYQENYMEEHNIVIPDGGDTENITNTIHEEYVATKEKTTVKINVKTNTDYSFSKYQLVNVEY